MLNAYHLPARLERFWRIAATLLLACLNACDLEHDPKAGQVAARFDGDEITVHEVSARLGELPTLSGANLSDAKGEVLEDLIDRRLLAKQAEDARLDRDPDVMRALQSARESVLGDALIRRKLAGRPEPTAVEIQSFIAAHPELFAQRRLYTLVNLSVVDSDARKISTRAFEGVRSIEELERLLKNTGIAYQQETLSVSAEQLPMALAKTLLEMASGDVATFENGGFLQLLYIHNVREEPLQGPEAEQNVRRYLLNIDRQRVTETTIEALRKGVKITYLGDFSGSGERRGTAAGTEIPGSTNDVKGTTPLPAHVERGIAGLVK